MFQPVDVWRRRVLRARTLSTVRTATYSVYYCRRQAQRRITMCAVTPRPRLLLERFHWISYVTLTQRRCEPLHAALATPHCSGMAHVDFQPSRRRGLAECRLRGIMTRSCGRGWVPAVGSVRGCSRGSAAPCETRSFASTTRISSGARRCFARGATSRRRTGCADRRDQHQEVDFILPSPGPVELDQRSVYK